MAAQKNFFNDVFRFIVGNKGILYSLSLLILIPAVLYYNTFFVIRTFQESVDQSLQTKAIMAESILSIFLVDSLREGNTTELQNQVEAVVHSTNDEIKTLRITQAGEGKDFVVLASFDPDEVGKPVTDSALAPALALASSQRQTIANLFSDDEQIERFWSVVQPVYDPDTGEEVALLSMSLSLQASDKLILDAILHAYIVVIAAIVLSLVLILQHTRLFGYVSLSQRLQEIDKMKDNFIRMATHELQSPVINIRGYLQALDEEISDNLTDYQKELFHRADISAKNLGDLIGDILEVSRIEQGRLDLTPERVNPVTVITEVFKEFEMKAQDKGLELKMELPEGEHVITANSKRLHQVLTNFVGNAIKYTQKGQVTVRAEADEARNKYTISVKDTGLGIPAEAQDQLFQRFYRVKTTQTAEIPGTGLGLWISKELTEKMGGQVFVESMEGVGSRFSLIFPFVKA